MRILALAAFVIALIGSPALAQEAASPFNAAVKQAQGSMMADPAAALASANTAETLAGANRLDQATAQWLQGEALNRLNRPQDAAAILDQALKTVAEVGPGSKLQGDVMMARAGAAAPQGDYTTALKNFQGAHDVFATLGQSRSQAMALLQIGTIYDDARDQERALVYYRRAADAYAGDPLVNLARLNNTANALRKLGRFKEAEAGFREALAIAEQMGSPMLRARILTNIAEVQIVLDQPGEAESTARSALKLNPEGWEQFLWGVLAQAAFARGETDNALTLIDRTFRGQDLTSTTMPYRAFHQTAYEIYGAVGLQGKALGHLEAFKRLDDEARDVAASANLALMGAQFDFANQELQIAQLRAKTLEAEVRQRQVVFGGLLGVGLIALGALGYGFWSMRRSRNHVQRVNEKLHQSNTALEKALKAKSEFLATTSHEIRTPLNGILGMTQVMLHDVKLTGDVRERVQIVHGAGETMRAIVDDILDVSKMETGALSVAAEPFNPKPVFEDVARLWCLNAEAKGVAFDVDLSQCPTLVVGDEQRLRQIVFNLQSNAVKFTDAGKISVSAHRDGEQLVLEVTDTGIGVPESEFEAIFSPFHQVNNTTTRQYGGTGLGLSICRNLSRAMGGEVTVRSKLGAGSTFSLRLPAPAAEESNNAAGVSAGGPIVIAVGSNPLHLCLLEAFSIENGRAFVAAADVPEALEQLATAPAELVYLAADMIPTCAGEAMSALMAVREAAPDARLVVAISEDGPLTGPAARLCGVDIVQHGDFDAAAILSDLPELTRAA